MIDPEKLEELQAKYPEGLTAVDTPFGMAVFKCPNRTQWKNHLRLVSDSKTLGEGAEWLCLACVVYPERPVFADWVERKPGLPSTIVKKIHILAGAASEELGEG